jgi:hypothetical protein
VRFGEESVAFLTHLAEAARDNTPCV